MHGISSIGNKDAGCPVAGPDLNGRSYFLGSCEIDIRTIDHFRFSRDQVASSTTPARPIPST